MLSANAREQMIEQQVRAWDVLNERVLGLLRKVPREHFVPAAQRYLAFADLEIPLPHEQHMLRPSVAGRLLQALELGATDRALQVGAGSGFVTACLASACAHVEAVEIFSDLAALARANLASLSVGNASVIAGDALERNTGSRYGVIAVTASLPVEDDRFQRQLEIGGRMFVVIGEAPVMDARLIRRTGENSWSTTSLFETVVDPMINARRPEEFTF